MPGQIRILNSKIEEGKKKVKEIADGNEESWELLLDGTKRADLQAGSSRIDHRRWWLKISL